MEEIVRDPVATDSHAADQVPDQPGLGQARRPADDPANVRDRALVERAVAGDLDAFNQLVALYQDYLFSLVVRVVNDRDSAADAVQEAFFSCYRNIHRFRGDSFRSLADAHRAERRDGHPALPQAPAGGSLSGMGGRRVATAGR